jgi:hypothetical protein
LNLANNTFLSVLSYSGGSGLCAKSRLLIKQAVAGVLNAAHPNIAYPIEPVSALVSQVNAALASCNESTILSLQSILDANNNLHNNQGCGN